MNLSGQHEREPVLTCVTSPPVDAVPLQLRFIGVGLLFVSRPAPGHPAIWRRPVAATGLQSVG